MKQRIVLAALGAVMAISGGTARAQNPERTVPKPLEPTAPPASLPAPPPPEKVEKDEEVLPKLRGIVLVDSKDKVVAKAAQGQAVTLNGDFVKPWELQFLASDYVGKPLTLQTLNDLTAAIVKHYYDNGRPVVDALVPEQDVESGFVQILVIEGKVGQVKIEGVKHFNPDRIRNQLRLQPGDVIDSEKLLRDVNGINANPFRQTGIVFERGQTPGSTDVVLQVNDRVPFRVYSSYDNTGSESTGVDRIVGGFNWGNAFGLDHQLNYQWTTSTDPSRFNAHGGSYVVPLSGAKKISVFGTYSTSQPQLQDRRFNLDGVSWQVSGRYETPLKSVGKYDHNLTYGLDYKRSNNNLENGGQNVYDRQTEVWQLLLSYDASYPDSYGLTRGNVDFVLSPGGLTPGNTTGDFDTARAGADPQYAYLRLNLTRETQLPKQFLLTTRFGGQIASEPLLSSEQIGFGGSDTLRGFPERASNGDYGFWITNELSTPPLRPLSAVQESIKDDLRFVAFFDYGIAYNFEPGEGTDARSALASTGLGVRYNIAPYLTLRYDYGWRVQSDIDDGESGKHHFSVSFSYSF
jgi:hemolysin activation/secretion protein